MERPVQQGYGTKGVWQSARIAVGTDNACSGDAEVAVCLQGVG